MRLANKISLLLITILISCFLAKQQSDLWDIEQPLCYATEYYVLLLRYMLKNSLSHAKQQK